MDKVMLPTKLQIGLDEDTALDRIISFVEFFGKAHLDLACHAAFPLVLTPDMLYQIWASFVPQAPWTAVADVLLSSLCSEVAYELYEMDTTIRNVLLKYLRDDARFGQPRLERLAAFLQQYIEPLAIGDNSDDQILATAQQWAALVYTQPSKAVQQIAEAFQNLNQHSGVDALRLASLVKSFSMPMAEVPEYRPLLIYATSIETMVRGDMQGATANLSTVVDTSGRVEVAPGLTLPPLMVQSESAGAVGSVQLKKRKPKRVPRPSAPPPILTYRNGPLLSAVEVFTIFWGEDWLIPPQSDMANSLNQFFDFILTSPLMDQLAEYSIQGGPTIGYGKRTGTLTITTPTLQSSVSDEDIQQMLQQAISSNSAFPQPSPNTLYFVYMQSGVVVVKDVERSCQMFCGYNNEIDGQVFYSVIPFADCLGCTGGLSVFDAFTSTSSHQLCTAITCPMGRQGWYDDREGGIATICAWQTKQIGNYTVQHMWSNRHNACI
jgi:hypothetical protein